MRSQSEPPPQNTQVHSNCPNPLTCVATSPQPEPPSLPAKLATPMPLTAPPLRCTQSINGWCVLASRVWSPDGVAAALVDNRRSLLLPQLLLLLLPAVYLLLSQQQLGREGAAAAGNGASKLLLCRVSTCR